MLTNDDNGEAWSLVGEATQCPPQDPRPNVNQAALPPPININQGRQVHDPPAPGAQQQQQMAAPENPQDFSGLGMALSRMGHAMYEPRTLEAELSLQAGIMEGNTNALARFKDFAVNYGQLRVYAVMVGDQKTITMIHTLGTFYSLKQATNAYQGKVVGFIGDRRATKEPTPICLPQTKAWQWFKGQASNDRELFQTHYGDPAMGGNFWRPPGDKVELTAPFLLALPSAIVENYGDKRDQRHRETCGKRSRR